MIDVEVSHFVFNGCSWTYGQGLDDIKEESFAGLLGKRFDLPVVNIAQPGSGNDSIVRRTYEYFYENIKNDSKPFFVISLSQLWRKEVWLNYDENYHPVNDYTIISYPREGEDSHDPMAKHIVEHMNSEDLLRRNWIQQLCLVNLFESHNIPYMITLYSDESHHEEKGKYVFKKYAYLYDQISSNCKILTNSLWNVSSGYPLLPCNHDGKEAQIALANFLETIMKRIYTIKKYQTTNFLKLKDMQHYSFSDWN